MKKLFSLDLYRFLCIASSTIGVLWLLGNSLQGGWGLILSGSFFGIWVISYLVNQQEIDAEMASHKSPMEKYRDELNKRTGLQ